MTRIQVLQDARAEWVEKNTALKEQVSEIYKQEVEAVSETISPFFKDFSPEVEVEVSKHSVYFKMDHPNFTYKKELFSLYLREDWNDEGTSFKGVDLSYYTTSTGGLDAWELKRLRMLGDVAHILLKDHDLIVAEANASVLPFKEKYRAIYSQQSLVQEAINDLDHKIRKLKMERVLFDLSTNGILFTDQVEIDLKHKYSPRIRSIKFKEVSKSGKTAVVAFGFYRGGEDDFKYTEENCNVERIVDQVAFYYYDKVDKDTKRELLPS